MCPSVTFSRRPLIGRVDQVSHRGMMGSSLGSLMQKSIWATSLILFSSHLGSLVGAWRCGGRGRREEEELRDGFLPSNTGLITKQHSSAATVGGRRAAVTRGKIDDVGVTCREEGEGGGPSAHVKETPPPSPLQGHAHICLCVCVF